MTRIKSIFYDLNKDARNAKFFLNLMQVNDDGKPTVDKCNVYDLDYASLNKLSIEQGTSANELFGQNLTTKNCTKFEYDNSEIESSIVTDVSCISAIFIFASLI